MNLESQYLEIVLLKVADFHFGLEARRVRSAWYQEACQAQLYASPKIPRLEDLLAIPEISNQCSPPNSGLLLSLRHTDGDWQMLISSPLKLYRLSLNQIYPLPQPIARQTRIQALAALALTPEGLILLLDAGRLGAGQKDYKTNIENY